MGWPVRMGHLLRGKVDGMPGPKPPAMVLSAAQRRELERLVSAHKTGQALVRRARVVLLAAMGYSNTDIAEQIPMDVEAVGLWRRRWVAFDAIPLDGAERRAAAGRCATTRCRTALEPGAGVPDPGAGVRAAERFGSTDQPLESPRAGRRDRASRHHRPHLAAPCVAVVEKRPTCSRTASAHWLTPARRRRPRHEDR